MTEEKTMGCPGANPVREGPIASRPDGAVGQAIGAPWRVSGDFGEVIEAVGGPDDGNVVCMEPDTLMVASRAHWPERRTLIAAAPELVEALREADRALECFSPFEAAARDVVGDTNLKAVLACRARIRSALTSAGVK